MTQHEYFLGIDGGGSKTEAILADSKGNIIGRGSSGPSNSNLVSIKEAINSIRDAYFGAVNRIDEGIKLSGVSLCIPGFTHDIEKKELAHLFRVELSQLNIYADHKSAYAGALLNQPGVIVLSGTGSFSYGKDHYNKEIIMGGWGPLIGDEGSGYYVGRMALSAMTKSFEGRGGITLLLSKILDYWGLKQTQELRNYLYSKDNYQKVISSLAPIVYECALKQDQISIQIINKAAVHLAKLAHQTIKQLNFNDNEVAVALTGGLSNFGTLIKSPFKNYLTKECGNRIQVKEPMFSPAIGSVIIAFIDGKKEITQDLIKNLKTSCEF